ncbi:MAG TPA: ABC transporter substrate-binding protein [Jatrophihabitans sp.]|jgi:polar amino acid transport system substrate-binding protein|uniref:ABC transporter substrate-binding protein n=1 Tax=Jatrophihabitans sp. TaxID=1932789 RepID=UPI002DFD9ECC|nr:ABC transporter substrate-binding protein [Jatrophihabitans sp.]
MTRSHRRVGAVLGLLGAGVALAGCASAAADTRAMPRTGVNAALHAALPAAVRQRGEIRVITDASYAPASSFAADGKTIVGFEPDLGAALGSVLGVRVVFANDDFAKLPGMLGRGQADMIMSAMTDTADRERTLDFVDYFSAGTSLVVQRGNPHGISDLESLCGQIVAVESGTVQAGLLARLQAHCGASPIRVLSEPTNDDAILQVRIGKAAALPMDYPPADVLTTDPHTRPNYQLASTAQYEPGLYGIGFAKDNTALRTAVTAALRQLVTDGTYRDVLHKWDVLGGAVRTISVNGA